MFYDKQMNGEWETRLRAARMANPWLAWFPNLCYKKDGAGSRSIMVFGFNPSLVQAIDVGDSEHIVVYTNREKVVIDAPRAYFLKEMERAKRYITKLNASTKL